MEDLKLNWAAAASDGAAGSEGDADASANAGADAGGAGATSGVDAGGSGAEADESVVVAGTESGEADAEGTVGDVSDGGDTLGAQTDEDGQTQAADAPAQANSAETKAAEALAAAGDKAAAPAVASLDALPEAVQCLDDNGQAVTLPRGYFEIMAKAQPLITALFSRLNEPKRDLQTLADILAEPDKAVGIRRFAQMIGFDATTAEAGVIPLTEEEIVWQQAQQTVIADRNRRFKDSTDHIQAINDERVHPDTQLLLESRAQQLFQETMSRRYMDRTKRDQESQSRSQKQADSQRQTYLRNVSTARDLAKRRNFSGWPMSVEKAALAVASQAMVDMQPGETIDQAIDRTYKELNKEIVNHPATKKIFAQAKPAAALAGTSPKPKPRAPGLSPIGSAAARTAFDDALQGKLGTVE